MHVCQHTEKGACDPCNNPLIYHKRESMDKFNKLVNNISHIIIATEFGVHNDAASRLIEVAAKQ